MVAAVVLAAGAGVGLSLFANSRLHQDAWHELAAPGDKGAAAPPFYWPVPLD